MEKHKKAQNKANKAFLVADHMINFTYPLIGDSKLLLAAMENLFMAQTNSMGAALYFLRHYKMVPPFHETFESKFNMFNAYIKKPYQFETKHMKMIIDIKNLLLAHKKSPVEFSRKGMFVICSDNFGMKTISVGHMKDYVKMTKEFMKDVDKLVNKHEKIVG